eukprot:31311-Pelagococcus_subviridis.AAC.3
MSAPGTFDACSAVRNTSFTFRSVVTSFRNSNSCSASWHQIVPYRDVKSSNAPSRSSICAARRYPAIAALYSLSNCCWYAASFTTSTRSGAIFSARSSIKAHEDSIDSFPPETRAKSLAQSKYSPAFLGSLASTAPKTSRTALFAASPAPSIDSA